MSKLSLLAAIIININIMLGTGIFINTSILTAKAGSISAFVYLLVGLLLLPLIMTIGQLLEVHHESGTFYDFGKSVSPFFGFVSSWSYFIGKLCTASLGIHVCMSFLQQLIPVIQGVSTLFLDLIVVGFFTLLNLLDLRVGRNLQYSFLVLKLIPIFFVIIAGFFFISGSNFTCDTYRWAGIPLTIPLVLYAYAGFEASCSLSTRIQDAKKNAPLAIFISYSVVVALLFLYQLFFYGSLGTLLGTLTGGYLSIFPEFLAKLHLSDLVTSKLLFILSLAVASSSLSSAYGVMYSNSWNLHVLAQHNHVFGKRFFTTKNVNGVPVGCIFLESFLVAIYLLITQGNQIPLQQVSALGSTIAYTFSTIALLIINLRRIRTLTLVPLLGLVSCLILLSTFFWSIATMGPTFLLMIFLGLLIFGSFMFYKMHDDEGPLDIYEEF